MKKKRTQEVVEVRCRVFLVFVFVLPREEQKRRVPHQRGTEGRRERGRGGREGVGREEGITSAQPI